MIDGESSPTWYLFIDSLMSGRVVLNRKLKQQHCLSQFNNLKEPL